MPAWSMRMAQEQKTWLSFIYKQLGDCDEFNEKT
jgi:hypothetical protein